MAAIETRNLHIDYPRGWRRAERRAVNGLNLSVREGEVVGFIGPNGAGKSSTIKALMGFLKPTSGDARLLGREAGSPDARRHVGFLPEVALYYPWLTPCETLQMYARLAGLDPRAAREQSAELLQRVGLGGRENDRLKGFSKGMLQRVGIAQALLGRPRLLILDEPSSGLDPLGRRELINVLLDEKKKGVTLFFSSHELHEVSELCDRVVLVQGGCVLDERNVSELRSDLRRYWIRFRCAGEPPIPAEQCGDIWEAEFRDLSTWRAAMAKVDGARAQLLDAGERESTLEGYFLRMVA